MKPIRSVLFLLTVSFLSFNILAQNDDDVISIDSSIVVINASVGDSNGRAVASAKAYGCC